MPTTYAPMRELPNLSECTFSDFQRNLSSGWGLGLNERRPLMPLQLAKCITDIGAEVRVRANTAALQDRSQRVEELLKIIAEREVAKAQAKGVSPR